MLIYMIEKGNHKAHQILAFSNLNIIGSNILKLILNYMIEKGQTKFHLILAFSSLNIKVILNYMISVSSKTELMNFQPFKDDIQFSQIYCLV